MLKSSKSKDKKKIFKFAHIIGNVKTKSSTDEKIEKNSVSEKTEKSVEKREQEKVLVSSYV